MSVIELTATVFLACFYIAAITVLYLDARAAEHWFDHWRDPQRERNA